jgi:RimJ/RimL family protein N-acetyltransferase
MLEGELVRLRAPQPDDLDRCHRWLNDPEVTRFLEGGRYPLSMAHEREWLDAARELKAASRARIDGRRNEGRVRSAGWNRCDP